MADPIDINRRNWDERAAIHARDTTGFYTLDRFRAGESALHGIEAVELGCVRGKRVLHLQCHIGLDTLRLVTRRRRDWARFLRSSGERRAPPCGGDRAEGELRSRDCRRGSASDARPIRSRLYDVGSPVLAAGYEDLGAGHRVRAGAGRRTLLRRCSSGLLVLEEVAGRLVPTYDFQTPADRPLKFDNAATYTGDPTVMTQQSTREWIHPLSAILGALIDAGLTITMFREHEVLPWRGVPMLVPAHDRQWRLPDGHPRIPLSFSVRAKKAV